MTDLIYVITRLMAFQELKEIAGMASGAAE